MRAARLSFALLVGLTLGAACRVTFTDDVRYTCASDADCGGDSFVCTAVPGGAGYCCRVSGAEVCGDGLDNDCDSLVDGADEWPAETCNGLDDDCDGEIDDGFLFLIDNANCGTCGRTCAANETCTLSSCVVRAEGNCNDGRDDDMNGLIDCADPSCNLASCGPGCQCVGTNRVEVNCSDGMDNDGDSQVDCVDVGCEGAPCAISGCTCRSTQKTETGCGDAADNDGDSLTDCADPDCGGLACQVGTTRTCANLSCQCNGGLPIDETLAAGLCLDRRDNDCDGLIDCQEASCDTAPCNPDGGTGCQCAGGKASETTCDDRVDNDADGDTDCADATDCPVGTACTYLNSGGQLRTGACTAAKVCL